MTRLFKHTQTTLRDAAGLPALLCARLATEEWRNVANSSSRQPYAVASDFAGIRPTGVLD